MRRNFGKSRMKSEESVKRRLRKLEKELDVQLDAVLSSEKGFGGPESLFWDGRCMERRVLRWILGLKHEPFCAADALVGW